jgi:hypothetical protein
MNYMLAFRNAAQPELNVPLHGAASLQSRALSYLERQLLAGPQAVDAGGDDGGDGG